MSRKKSGAERRKIRARNKEASLRDSVGDAVPELPVVSEEASHQGESPDDGQHIKDSPWWRELSAENIAKAEAMGMGAAVSVMKERRLELRAVAENWPISQAVRERIVYESMIVLLDPKADPRLKQRERWMLHKMFEANRNPNLPTQLAVTSTTNNTINAVNVREVLDMMREDPEMRIMDMREHQIAPGSPEDYAE